MVEAELHCCTTQSQGMAGHSAWIKARMVESHTFCWRPSTAWAMTLMACSDWAWGSAAG